MNISQLKTEINATYLNYCRSNCYEANELVRKHGYKVDRRSVYDALLCDLPERALRVFGHGKTFKREFREFTELFIHAILVEEQLLTL